MDPRILPFLQSHSTAIVLSSTVAVSLALVIKWIRPKPLPGIPHHPITSFWGDLPAMAKAAKEYGTIYEHGSFFEQSMRELGPVFQIFIGPFSKTIVITDPQEIEDLHLRERSKFIDASDVLIRGFQSTIPLGQVAMKTNDVWRKHRRITAPIVSSKYLNQLAPVIDHNTRLLVEYWEKKIEIVKREGGTCFACAGDFQNSALDMISQIIAGRSLQAIPNAIAHLSTAEPTRNTQGALTFPIPRVALLDATHYLFRCIGDAVTLPPVLSTVYQKVLSWTPRFQHHYGVICDHIDSCLADCRKDVQQARALGEDPDLAESMLGMIAAREGAPGQDHMSDKEIRDEVLTSFFAGHDTSSLSMQWCVKFLTDSPHIQKALHNELVTAIGDPAIERRPLTFADVSSPDRTPYLEAVVIELLRCARVAEGTSKQTTADITVLGYAIPANTDLIFPMTSNQVNDSSMSSVLHSFDKHRSPASRESGSIARRPWKNGKDFDPERWLGDNGDGTKRFNARAGFANPFGQGVRACAGKQLALLELKMYIAALSLAFFFDKIPEELSSYVAQINVTRSPIYAYVNPKPWKEVQA
ncbi:hypothetical protein FRB90_011668 [Tulasnella sp. 427]|nr:hypothetical protein FRB90_011668 [Tulasnella sp. 427]